MNKTRVLLASLLKPVNDTRMYEKLGISISQLPDVEVHICGFNSPLRPIKQPITFHALFNFCRLSFGRIKAQLIFLKLLFEIKPQVLIVCTHELLLGSLLYKMLHSCKLIYDVQENYYLNLTSQKVYAPALRYAAAGVVRLIEKATAPFIHTFFLAEESYQHELEFTRDKSIILQNKYKPATHYLLPRTCSGTRLPTSGPIKLIYSGTISELYGIFEAINFCEALHQENQRYSLTIIGYWPQKFIGEQVKNLIRSKPYITLLGGDTLVPHSQIIQAITTAHVGLLPYHPHPSLVNCRPTKLFEYLAHALPLVVQNNPLWSSMVSQLEAGISIDFGNFDPTNTRQLLESNIFYPQVSLEEAFWQAEEIKLLSYFQQTILNG